MGVGVMARKMQELEGDIKLLKLCRSSRMLEIKKLKEENEKLKKCVEYTRKIAKYSDIGLGEPWWRENMQKIRNKTGEALKEIQ